MDQQMSPASSILEQPLATTDSPRNCEENTGQVSSPALATCFLWGVFLMVIFETNDVKTFTPLVVADSVHHPTQAPEGGCSFPHSSSTLTALYQESPDMALVPQSPSPLAESVTNGNDCKVATVVRLQVLRSLAV
jgi:hypothetical protein